ncbi:PEP-utilizing enzyme [Nonomuraea sp. NBC_00507]|uniref:PEP-utilizing enzyme n=1 Tax=Nonomuraea sp. NBC_00507 TaxID=2976002 RepID=UPI002E17C364
MSTVVPVDEFISDEWYPGFRPGRTDAGVYTEALSTFRKEDEDRFWLLDFHYPRGMVPLGYVFPEDGICFCTQQAAEGLPLPTSGGLGVRMAGPHIYTSEVPVTSRWAVGERVERIQRALPAALERFQATWADRVTELNRGLAYFEGQSFDGRDLADLARLYEEAVVFHRRAWTIHFEIMYPLLATYVGFHGTCLELGIDAAEISKFLQGYDSKIMETDRGLWELTRKARAAGLADVFAVTDATDLNTTLRADPAAKGWVADFDAFLQTYGHRTEGIADVVLTPWIDDPVSPLGTVRTYLSKGSDHDFAGARAAAVAEREQAIEAARGRLTVEERRVFDAGLAACTSANFAWWNEDHNYYIDLRAHIPMRRAGLAIARALGAERPDDGLFVFRPELRRLAEGHRDWGSMRKLVDERRAYYEHWLARRPRMPKVLGTVPEDMSDPVMREIFGTNAGFFAAMKQLGGDTSQVTSLSGVAASSGVARGVARVLHGAEELHRIEPGEILVCEATSPNWTPAFAKIAACVCDSGGTLTHASIVSREYRIPCVCGVGIATSTIRTGDEIEVDGTRGTVRILKRAER